MSMQHAISPLRQQNFPEWYQAVVKAAEMAENAPVRGCMVIKPYGFAVWENIQAILGKMIKDNEVQNAYFPLLIPVSYLSKEAEHIEGFAKECAVVTHHRLEKGPEGNLIPAGPLAEPYVIRPTSETIIGEVLSNWIQSYRDLPLKLNQWCNVMRWEMRPRVFLRTSEFLWQEGHNCFASAQEADQDARKMISMYASFLRDYMAIPGLEGEKTAEERFPGALATYTYESMMQDGKAAQMCTSHDLGQNFAKSSKIEFQTQDGVQAFAHTTSWGLTTRTIGALIMIHGDDDGVIMPPKIAPYPVKIIPLIRDESTKEIIFEQSLALKKALENQNIGCVIDKSDAKSPHKIWSAIKQGVPLRVELGMREIENNQLTYSRRDQDKSMKYTCSMGEFIEGCQNILADIQKTLLERANKRLYDHLFKMETLQEADDFFLAKKIGFVSLPISEIQKEDFQKLKIKYAITPRCLPFQDQGQRVIVGQSY